MAKLIGTRSAAEANGEGRYAVYLGSIEIWRGHDKESAKQVARRSARESRALGLLEEVYEIWDMEDDV